MADKKDVILTELPSRLKAVRKEKGLSLDAISKLSGVSRSMVSQIERGDSSPTIATLWNLTSALQVDLAELMESSSKASIEVLPNAAVPSIENQRSGCTIRILSPPEEAGNHEVYELIFTAGGLLDSAPHSPGSREHLTVIEGTVIVTSGGASETLSKGDTGRYRADVAHAIQAEGAARAFLIVKTDQLG